MTVDRTERQMADAVHDLTHGDFVVVAMEGDISGSDWLYTIGLGPIAGHPELVMLDTGSNSDTELLGSLGAAVCSGVRLDAHSMMQLEDGRTVRITALGEGGGPGGGVFAFGRLALTRVSRPWSDVLLVTVLDVDVATTTRTSGRVLPSSVRIS